MSRVVMISKHERICSSAPVIGRWAHATNWTAAEAGNRQKTLIIMHADTEQQQWVIGNLCL